MFTSLLRGLLAAYITVISLSANAWNQVGGFQEFAGSLGLEFNWDTTRLMELDDHVSIGAMWPIYPEAQAVYHPMLNRVGLKPSLLALAPMGQQRILSTSELRQKYDLAWSSYASTIFHELSHGEMDVFIESPVSYADKILWNTLNGPVRSWFKRNYPRVNSSTAIQELFGYYRAEIITYFADEYLSALVSEGVNPISGQCHIFPKMKETIKELSKSDYLTHQFSGDFSQSVIYGENIGVNYIFIRGKSLKLNLEKDPFKKEWFSALWEHFTYFYVPPQNRKEWLDQLFLKPGPFSEFLKDCRSKAWEKHHNKAS